jgi:hypothetical protein
VACSRATNISNDTKVSALSRVRVVSYSYSEACRWLNAVTPYDTGIAAAKQQFEPGDSLSVHPPIDRSSKQIRLPCFSDDGNFILKVYDMRKAPTYVALGYTWGSLEDHRDSVINGRAFEV